MSLPFTIEQFLGVFARYNEAVWPMQVVLNALAAVAIGLAVRERRGSNRAIAAILGLLWLWTGVVYHLLYFSTINQAAYLFCVLSVAQSAIVLAQRPSLARHRDPSRPTRRDSPTTNGSCVRSAALTPVKSPHRSAE